jgi:uncharacterized protein YkuJ
MNSEVRIIKRVLLLTFLISFIGYSQFYSFNPSDNYRLFECTEVYFNIENLNGKTTREYDENGNLILNIAYVYNLESESFFTSYKREYTYDENGNQILRINYGWSPETLFYPDNKYEMSYDENGNLTFLFIYGIENHKHMNQIKNIV